MIHNTHKGLMGMKRTHASDAWRVAAFIALSGGFQDAYSFLARGHVFANAQTGNIVLFGTKVFALDIAGAIHYLLPVTAFMLGVLAAFFQRRRSVTLHWRQEVLIVEVVLLFIVGFIPSGFDFAANAIVSFTCAMQVQAFRKIHGNVYSSTMCIGNLRSFAEWYGRALSGGGRRAWLRAERYLGIIALFALGATLGSLAVPKLGIRAIWCSCVFLVVSFALMFEKRELEQESKTE